MSLPAWDHISDARSDGGTLIVAADARELWGLRRRLQQVVSLPWAVDVAWSALWRSRIVYLVANGPGPRLAEEAMRESSRHASIGRVVSTGYCGGLDPALRVLDVFAATEVRDVEGNAKYGAEVPERARMVPAGILASLDRVVGEPVERRALWADGARVVDMEAGAVARIASEWGLPFACLRIVTDAADERFVLNFNGVRRADGRFSVPRIVWAGLRRPATVGRGLWDLQQRSRAAAERLGEFLVATAL